MWKRTFAALAVGVIAAPFAFAQDQPAPRPRVDVQTAPQKDAGSARQNLAFRSSDLEGLDVRNKAGETVGSVNDLVIDVESGKVRYVAVAYGGFAGIGDKLFAVPMNQFKVMKDAEDDVYFFSTNLTEEKMKNAPGFDQDNWPTMASQTQWTQQVDEYYGAGETVDANDRPANDNVDADNDTEPDRVAPRVDIEVTPRPNRDR